MIRFLAALLLLSAPARAASLEIDKAQDLREQNSPVLISAAASDSPEARRAALRAMGRIQSPAYLPTLISALKDPDDGVRREAAFSLGQLAMTEEGLKPEAQARASQALINALPGGSTELRAAILEALGKAGGEGVSDLLTAAAKADPDAPVRAEATAGVFRLRYLKRIPEYSTAAVTGLLNALGDAEAEPRWRAAYAFSRWPEPRAQEKLKAACADPDVRVRLFSVRALGQLKKDAPAETLKKALKDADYLVRTEAVKALGAAAQAELIGDEVLRDPSAHVRAAAADALAETGKLVLAEALAALLNESSPLVRGQAVLAYAKLRKDGALDFLEKERTFPHWWVKSKAYEAMDGLSGAQALLKEGAADPDPRIAAAALETLAKSTAPFVTDLLISILLDPKSGMELRGTAVDAAGARKSEAFIEPLLAALQNSSSRENAELREDIVKALQAIVKEHPEAGKGRLFEAASPPPAPSPFLGVKTATASVVLETEKGEIEIQLAVDEAPIHSAHFLASVASGTYNGTIWHRVVSGFVVQGGDPRGSGWGDCGFSMRDEINPLHFGRGAVGMPKAGKDTGGCQLFITHIPTPHLDGRYTVFGQVTRGMDVVDKIEPGDKIIKARLK